ncbi:MAG: hypothetical protein H7Y11_04425 [Armatimonadetes bacterium]|nr:hypothetical protein [Anaerolineae bacterium]
MNDEHARLAQILGFTPDDQAANQRGELTAAQRQYVQILQHNHSLAISLVAIILLAFSLGLVLIAGSPGDPASITVRTIVLLVCAGLAAVSARRAWECWYAPLKVEMVSGGVEPLPESDRVMFLRGFAFILDILAMFGGWSSTGGAWAMGDYQLRVGVTVLSIDARTHAAFQYGSKWHVYYLRLPQLFGSKVIMLSAAPAATV